MNVCATSMAPPGTPVAETCLGQLWVFHDLSRPSGSSWLPRTKRRKLPVPWFTTGNDSVMIAPAIILFEYS